MFGRIEESRGGLVFSGLSEEDETADWRRPNNPRHNHH